jgi:hypothetical protein
VSLSATLSKQVTGSGTYLFYNEAIVATFFSLEFSFRCSSLFTVISTHTGAVKPENGRIQHGRSTTQSK